MNTRVRLLMSLVLTLVIVGGGVLTWGLRTGQLTIFGDAPKTISATLGIISSVDLQKGIDAGDHQLILLPSGLGLAEGTTSGTAIFTLGQREIVAIDRVVPIITDPLPTGSMVTMAFAGSPDGVSFNPFSPPQTVKLSAKSATATPMQLGFLIPADSRFIRVKLTISRTDPTSQPILTGFTMNYSQRPLTVTGAQDETVLVNGSPANVTTAAPLPGRPASLVVTGNASWVMLLVGIWLTGLWMIWSLGRHKGGHGSTATDG